MNLFQLVFKQMRQRSLSTWLTMLSVVLGVALAIAVMILQREGRKLFGQSDYGYQLIIAGKGSPLQVTLNTVYGLDKMTTTLPYSVYEELAAKGSKYAPDVKIAIPTAVGDTYKNLRIIGTIPQLFGHDDNAQKLPAAAAVLEYRPGKRYEFAQGTSFHARKFQAVIGSDVTELAGLKLGDKFKATHGSPTPNQLAVDEHNEEWEVVGVLAPTRTAADKDIFIPLITFYTIEDHEIALTAHDAIRKGEDPNAAIVARKPQFAEQAERDDAHDHDHDHPATGAAKLQATPAPGGEGSTAGGATGTAHDHDHAHAYHVEPDGTIDLHVPKDRWEVSAILVRTRAPFSVRSLQYEFNNGPVAMAVNPAEEMTQFFRVILAPSSRVLLLVSLLVTIVAVIGILVSIYNSVSARIREIAILRALGATRRRILTLICLEAGLIGLLGGVAGLIVGHLLGALGSVYSERVVGEGINWTTVGGAEWLYLLIVTAVAVLAGLVPALKAYRTPVATNLSAE